MASSVQANTHTEMLCQSRECTKYGLEVAIEEHQDKPLDIAVHGAISIIAVGKQEPLIPNDKSLSGTGSPSEYGSSEEKIRYSRDRQISFNQSADNVSYLTRRVKGSTFVAHNISYKVDVRTKLCCGPKKSKTILKQMNAIFKPGMNAILGPTGSGKSSLLDVLAGRKDPAGLTGSLLIDGSPPPKNFKCMVGYVVQDDVVMGTLTVRENFHFSAALRMPSSVDHQERSQQVESMLLELGLTHVADSRIGNEFIRGVSGGERKRTIIGMELIISPPVLFLDEPTTGLDASTANAVMLLLKRLSRRGRTIIFSIHQPRYSIYRLFDHMVLLSQGQIVYHGPSDEALDFFKGQGFECEEHNNPPDFFLDIINGDSTAVTKIKSKEQLTGDQYDDSAFQDETVDVSSMHYRLSNYYKSSPYCKRSQTEADEVYDTYMQTKRAGLYVPPAPIQHNTSFLWQLLIVGQRAIKNLWRNPQTSIMQVVVTMLFAVIVGAIYFQIDHSALSGIQNRVGAFFFIVMNQIFGNMAGVELFIKEKVIFLHESVSGYYRVSAYFFAKVFCDLVPMRLIPVMFFSLITYFMIGLRMEVDYFFIYMLTLFLASVCTTGLAFFISASVRIFAVATLLMVVCLVFMMVFSGLLVNLTTIAEWLRWIKYLSIFRYGLTALEVNELHGQTFCNHVNGTRDNSTCVTGDQYLDSQGIEYGTSWDFWQSHVALASMTIILFILTYIQLRRVNKLK